MLTISELHVSYGRKKVLENLNLKLKTKQIHGIVGLNGSGKTTLLNSIFGIKPVDKGGIRLGDSKISKTEIGYMESQNFFYPRITGREYLRFFQITNPDFNIENWNKVFELPLNELIDNYSTGMKKKLAFLGVLCLDKPVVILDEPFNGVDLESNQKIKTILQTLRSNGKTILITSHILEALTSLCDTISYLNNRNFQFTCTNEEYTGLEEKIFSIHNNKSNNLIEELLSKGS